MEYLQNISEEDKKMLASNLDVLYAYLDLYMDLMTEEEVIMWRMVLQEIDPHFKNEENE